MSKIFVCLMVLIFSTQMVCAYKVYHYNEKGERVYRTIEQKEFAKYKNAPRHAFVRCPRRNWEITDSMRARKLTSSQFTHRN